MGAHGLHVRGPRSIGSSFDFDVSAVSAHGNDSLWTQARIQVNTLTSEVTSVTFVSGITAALQYDFGPFVMIAPPGRAAFVLRAP
jgi:hypothetical protein